MKEVKANVDEKIQQELDKAWQSVTTSKYRTEVLHKQWMDHLHKLSMGVVLMSMHQFSQPVKDCIMEIKSIATIALDNSISMSLILNESLVEFLNFLIALLIFRFTSFGEGDMTKLSYKLSSALIPVCLGSYFQYSRKGCIPEGFESHLREDFVKSERQFPVSICFHFILTGCLIFMSIGMRQVSRNIEGVKRIRDELFQSLSNTDIDSASPRVVKQHRSNKTKKKIA